MLFVCAKIHHYTTLTQSPLVSSIGFVLEDYFICIILISPCIHKATWFRKIKDGGKSVSDWNGAAAHEYISWDLKDCGYTKTTATAECVHSRLIRERHRASRAWPLHASHSRGTAVLSSEMWGAKTQAGQRAPRLLSSWPTTGGHTSISLNHQGKAKRCLGYQDKLPLLPVTSADTISV